MRIFSKVRLSSIFFQLNLMIILGTLKLAYLAYNYTNRTIYLDSLFSHEGTYLLQISDVLNMEIC